MTSPIPPDALRFLESFKFGSERAWGDVAEVCDAAVERIMVLGDIHASGSIFAAALRVAAAEGCDVVVQVGDFWLEDSTWRGWVPKQARLIHTALHSPVPVVVVDGNHEVWPCLTGFLHRCDTQAARRQGRPLHLGGSLWWADRGSVWSWGGARFGALGGTVSPDKWILKLAKYRWAEETTTQQDLDRLINNAPEGLDVLICHDAPADAQGLVSGLPWPMPHDIEREAKAMRALLQSAVDATTPELVFHGHWHQQNRCRINSGASEVVGLAADGHPASAAIMSIPDLQARYVHPLRRPTQASRPPKGKLTPVEHELRHATTKPDQPN